ncbi:MAG: glycine betaine ABC transporter substrate-binding protein [Desulfuromonadales bacterium]|nr:glycine betaine ABC transporter substrate-binding protein [Desulfuromonadales bacterium]NIR33167.1 glycine betaine ABC transporter substrate-binding protein [Desulfuromonadales bacterium]NIS39386.1 glycine betaine ABC transporter substrate-binding protein [Desulfuromonadales bacterium]
MLALVFAGCSKQEETSKTTEPAEKAAEEKKGTVELAYVEWSSEVASTNVVMAVLQEKMGYDVEITPVSAAAMWQSVASGDSDGLVAAWLPTTHGHYLEKLKEDVVDLGPNLTGTKIGLVVPSYVEIDSIAKMEENAEKFDGKIIGIDPGAGIMSKTEKVLEDYALESFELVSGSGATMTAALADAIKNEEWIAVTGWTPHWKFAKWDLKYLDDPKGTYGGEEAIHTIVRKGLKEDMPEVYAFLDNFEWTPDEMAELMVWNQEEDSDPYETAKRWIEENPEKVNAWLP